jgi:hypothetical protein
MSRLLIPLMTGLLWAGSSTIHARELNAGDPVRASLVAVARETPAAGLPADSRLSLSRAWVEGSQAKVCAMARNADGDLLVQDGQLQIKRVNLRKRGSVWIADRSERIPMGQNKSIDTACGERSSEAIMTATIKMLEDHPPTAGIKTKAPVAAANCRDAAPKGAATEPAGPGLVSLPGRSLLHTAPDLSCLMGKFIVGGDKVNILAHVPGWSRVRYTHPLTGAITEGWLKSERVKLGQNGDQSHAALAH